MTTNTNLSDIKAALKRIKPFTDARPFLPILNYAKLESSNGSLRITVPKSEGYGVAISFTTATVSTGLSEYSVCVKYADLRKVVDKCKNDIAFTVTDGHTLKLESGSVTFKLNGKDTADFPAMSESRDDLKASTSVSYGEIRSEMDFVYAATESSTAKNFTSGVLFDYSEPYRLRLVGTDGRRLHSTYAVGDGIGFASATDIQKRFLVPAEWVKGFNALKVPDSENVIIGFFGDDSMQWNIPGQGLSGTVSLLDTPYPDYWKVIPDDCTSRFRLNVPDTIEALNALSVIANQNDGRDMVVINANGFLNLSARSDTMGDASGIVPCTHIDGPEAVFALNINFFTETLKLSDTDSVLMSNSGSLEPARFDYPETERIAVVMPVRLPE